MFISEPTFFDRVDNAEEIVLRESYQVPSIEALRENFRKGVKAQILASMVGSGKTVMAAYLLRECWNNEKKAMFVVDRDSLLGQTSELLSRYGIPHGIIQGGNPNYRPGELIQVAMVQTLARRGWPDCNLIIIDEAHIRAKTAWDKISRRDCRIVGLTATPFTRGLGKVYEAIVNVTTGNQLTSEGFLVPFRVWAAKEPDMTGAATIAGEWTKEEASKRAMPIIGDVVKEYEERGLGEKAICFGVDVAHCEEMQRQFISAGINARLYCHTTLDEDREYLIGKHGEFRKPDSEVRVLISVAALSRGFDVPDVGVIIMCRPLKNSFAEFIQVLGRGLRSHPGKTECRILDLAGNFMRHYPAMVEFFEEGAQTLDDGKPKPPTASVPAEKKPRKCPKCKYVFGAGSSCPACGYIFPPAKSAQHEAGALGEFDGSHILKLDRTAKMKLHAELTYYCNQKKWKPGWIAHTYRRITGVWPSGVQNGAEPPSQSTLLALAKLQRQPHQKPVAVNSGALRAIPEELNLFL